MQRAHLNPAVTRAFVVVAVDEAIGAVTAVVGQHSAASLARGGRNGQDDGSPRDGVATTTSRHEEASRVNAASWAHQASPMMIR